MSYAAGEALLLTQIRATSDFGSSNSSRGIYTILNSGADKSYAILRPGSFTHTQKSLGALNEPTLYESTWITVCELFVRLKDYGETLAELVARRQDIIDRFDQYPHAADTNSVIEDVMVTTGGDVFEIASATGAPLFIKQELTIEWKENSNVTIQE